MAEMGEIIDLTKYRKEHEEANKLYDIIADQQGCKRVITAEPMKEGLARCIADIKNEGSKDTVYYIEPSFV